MAKQGSSYEKTKLFLRKDKAVLKKEVARNSLTTSSRNFLLIWIRGYLQQYLAELHWQNLH